MALGTRKKLDDEAGVVDEWASERLRAAFCGVGLMDFEHRLACVDEAFVRRLEDFHIAKPLSSARWNDCYDCMIIMRDGCIALYIKHGFGIWWDLIV